MRSTRVILARVLLSIAVGMVFGCSRPAPSAFQAHMDEYTKAPITFDQLPPPEVGPRVRPKLKPKIIPVDMDKKVVDVEIYNALPEEWRAATPEEVGTIVQIRWKEVGESDKFRRKVPIIKFESSIIDRVSNVEVANAGSQRAVNPRTSDRSAFVKSMVDEIVRQSKRFSAPD